MSSKVRLRFAPSPTGHLHVGGARTALYSYLYAKGHDGEFILRVEDTDEERSTEEAMKSQLEALDWLGLRWDEGPDAETLVDRGDHGPYRQSQRLAIYKKYSDQLLAEGLAYYCFLTDEEIDAQREKAKGTVGAFQVESPYREWTLEQAQKRSDAGENAVVRFKADRSKTHYQFKDLVRGDVKFPSDMVGDFVLLRSSGMPVYNFCCVIDDALMQMTHVFRSEEHLNNTLRQLMIYEALGFQIPEFGHFSMILGEDKQKLSKRHGATSVQQFRDRGFLPDALINYLALLGWTHPKEEEILPKADLVSSFGLDRITSSPAVFDEKKLTWINANHIKRLDKDRLWGLLEPRLKAAGLELPTESTWIEKSLQVFSSYLETLEDAVSLYQPISPKHFDIDAAADQVFEWDTSKSVFEAWKSILSATDSEFLSEEQFVQAQDQVKESCGVKGKNLFMPIRVAIIGKPHGAELKILVPLVSKSELLRRVDLVLAKA